MAANIEMARREWKSHQGNAWFFFFILFLVSIVFFGFGLRFLRPQLMLSLLFGTMIFQTLVYFYSESIVKNLMACAPPDEKIRQRLNKILQTLAPKSGLKHFPNAFVSRAMEAPNAFAFGKAFGTSYNIAVTEELLELLNDEELEAVIGHELGHLRSKDIAAMTLVSITLAFINRIAIQCFKIGKLGFAVAIIVEAVIYIPRIVASAVSQLREFAADAHSAMITGKTTALISAFKKLTDWRKENKEKNPLRWFQSIMMDELLLSHPDMEMRIEFLKDLEEKPKEQP